MKHMISILENYTYRDLYMVREALTWCSWENVSREMIQKERRRISEFIRFPSDHFTEGEIHRIWVHYMVECVISREAVMHIEEFSRKEIRYWAYRYQYELYREGRMLQTTFVECP